VTRRGARLAASLLLAAVSVAAGLGVDRTASPRLTAWVVVTRDDADVADVLADHGVAGRTVFDAATARRIGNDPRVASIEPDTVVVLDGTQTTGPAGFTAPAGSPNVAVPWGLDVLDARTAGQDDSYSWTNDGTGVNVYVLDTGVQADHPEFGSRVSTNGWGYRKDNNGADPNAALPSYVEATTLGADNQVNFNPCVSKPATQQNLPSTFDYAYTAGDNGTVDNNGHGTHVSGTVAGTLTGVAKNVTIIPVRALDSCGQGTLKMFYKALIFVRDDHDPGEKAILNMSIGLDVRSTTLDGIINQILAEGVVTVAASGNDATSACNHTPADTAGVISVGAVGHDLAESRFSNFGSCVDIFAPGGQVEADGVTAYSGRQIVSTWPKQGSDLNTYSEAVGTSMATPHVTGAVATWLQGQSAASTNPADAWTWLRKNATCGLVTYVRSSVTQTPNRMLSLAAPGVPCAPSNVAVTQASGQSTVSWDEVPSANGSDITGYQVTTAPASSGCTTNASTYSCLLTGLTDGTAYAVSVTATNGIGPGAAATKSLIAGPTGTLASTTTAPTTTAPTTTTTVPDPVAPGSADTITSSSSSITISWPATAPAGTVTYQVTISPRGSTCTTTTTSCTFAGLTPGTNYTFSISARNASGTVSGSTFRVSAVAGFTQSVKSVKVRSRTLLSRIVRTVSKGKRTYTVTSGRCRISVGRLVAPTTAGTCKVRVSVAKSGTYRAFRTTITLAVTK
jgi:subtilisin family serine protease